MTSVYSCILHLFGRQAMRYDIGNKSERKIRNGRSCNWMLGMERFANPEDLRNKCSIY